MLKSSGKTVRAMEIIQQNEKNPPCFLTMGGLEGWKEEDRLGKVKHFGFLEDARDQALVYAAADGFLCTTLADGQPQTALESLACGTPVIAFDIGPMPDLALEGQTGILVSEVSANALADALVEQFLISDTLADMRERCRKFAVERFDLQRQTNRYVDLYERILLDE